MDKLEHFNLAQVFASVDGEGSLHMTRTAIFKCW